MKSSLFPTSNMPLHSAGSATVASVSQICESRSQPAPNSLIHFTFFSLLPRIVGSQKVTCQSIVLSGSHLAKYNNPGAWRWDQLFFSAGCTPPGRLTKGSKRTWHARELDCYWKAAFRGTDLPAWQWICLLCYQLSCEERLHCQLIWCLFGTSFFALWLFLCFKLVLDVIFVLFYSLADWLSTGHNFGFKPVVIDVEDFGSPGFPAYYDDAMVLDHGSEYVLASRLGLSVSAEYMQALIMV